MEKKFDTKRKNFNNKNKLAKKIPFLRRHSGASLIKVFYYVGDALLLVLEVSLLARSYLVGWGVSASPFSCLG